MGSSKQTDLDPEWVDAAFVILRLADQAQRDENRPLAERYVRLAMFAFDSAIVSEEKH
jgi:hypothetical protein